jgi:hypothetical protein
MEVCMGDLHGRVNELLDAAFREMMAGATPELRQAGEKRALELGKAHYSMFAGFVVRHPNLAVRNEGLRLAAQIGTFR